jgi:hypothetical protein
LSATGATTLSAQLTASTGDGSYPIISKDTRAFSAGVTGPQLGFFGLDSTSTNNSLGAFRALAQSSQEGTLEARVLSSGSLATIGTFSTTGLGIGTTSPSTSLTVSGANTAARGQVSVIGASTADARVTLYRGSTLAGAISNTSTQMYLLAAEAVPLVFYTSDTERARITSAGEWLVGTTTNAGTTVGSRMFPTGLIQGTRSESTNAATNYDLYSTGASAYRFYVGMGGTIFATSITISAISDQRLKENVRDIDTGLDAIMALKPRRFDWKEGKGQDKKDVAGFIAQEFEDVFPECVSTSKAGADGIEYKNINHETLIPTLVKAMQELKAEFDAYKASHP